MSWPNTKDRNELAKEMFGEDADAVKAKLDKLATIETTLASTKETLDKQNTLIETLTKSVNEKVTSPYSDDRRREEPTNDAKKLTDWGDDAEQAFKERVGPIVGAVMNTNGNLVKREVMETLDKQYHDWHLFAPEIDELSKTATPQQKNAPDFWRHCYFSIKGQHHDDIIRDNNAKEGKFFLESASTSVILRGDENRKPEDVLTDEEKRVANNLNVPLDIYMKNRQSYGVQK